MFFLEIPNFWEGVASTIGGTVFDAIRSLFYLLDTVVYNIIIYLYNWFLMLCNGRLLDNEVVQTISSRFGLILGIFMFFTVAIAFLRMILDPDKITDKETGVGSIIKKVLLVVIMLGLSNFAFDTLYDLQSILLGNNKSGVNVIQNLFSPYVVDSRDFGVVLSSNIFTNFYSVDSSLESSSNQDVLDCVNYNNILKNQIMTSYSFDFGYNCLNAKTTVTIANSGGQSSETYIMDFKFLESFIVGCVIVYMIFMYCIKVGVRMVQLAFLEILSPMAIISYLSPKKDTMFNKWGKVYISTYIDVFIRLAIINLTVYLICVVLDGWSEASSPFWQSFSISNPLTRTYIGVIMILALLTFAKRAPDLLKAILPSSDGGSGLGFGIGKKDNEFGFGLLGGIGAKGAGVLGGAVGGLAGGLAAGSLGGAAFGLLRGGVGGLKNKKLGDSLKSVSGGYGAQKNASLRTAQRLAEGGSRIVFPGAQARANMYDEGKSKLESQNAAYNQLSGYFSKAKERAKSKILEGDYNNNTSGLAAFQAAQRVKDLQAQSGNLKLSDFYDFLDPDTGKIVKAQEQYDDAYAKLQAKIKDASKDASDALDNAMADYFANGNDAVVQQNMSMAQAVIDNNDYDGFKGQKVSDFASFKNADGAAQSAVSSNTVKLAENAREGKRARADAKYSGKN